MSLKFFTNKHVVAAFIITPILAVLGYMLADNLVSEKPQVAQAGNSYPLVAQSNCRFTSGECDLRNNDFLARLVVDQGAEQPRLVVRSEHELDQVVVGLNYGDSAADQGAVAPQPMTWSADAQQWMLSLPKLTDENTQLQIVLMAGGVKYFAETAMAFTEYKTAFDRDF